MRSANLEIFIRSEGDTELFVEFHIVVFSEVVFCVVEFPVVAFQLVVFQSGIFHAANVFPIDAIQSNTPINRDIALIPLYLLIFLTPYHNLVNIISLVIG
jgi:hypothetical protein